MYFFYKVFILYENIVLIVSYLVLAGDSSVPFFDTRIPVIAGCLYSEEYWVEVVDTIRDIHISVRIVNGFCVFDCYFRFLII